MRALALLLVLAAGCRAENATKNATASDGAATSALVELDEKKCAAARRRPRRRWTSFWSSCSKPTHQIRGRGDTNPEEEAGAKAKELDVVTGILEDS